MMLLAATQYVKCGTMIPRMAIIIPKLTSTAVDILKIAVPVLLIIFGMLDLMKGVIAQKEDEIKKAQGLFVKRLISAAIVFLVFIIVEVVFNLIAGSTEDNSDNIWKCVDCFINGPGEGGPSNAPSECGN